MLNQELTTEICLLKGNDVARMLNILDDLVLQCAQDRAP